MSDIHRSYFYEIFFGVMILIFIYIHCRRKIRTVSEQEEDQDTVAIIMSSTQPENTVPLAVAIQPPSDLEQVILADIFENPN